ncbi:hypothetical protein Bca4012_002515 [Brassica carinata]|uniref:Uncharacterized protein n=1 Tax=Brassica carinata TaxID=52824 RepID=A0A8X7RVB7_BRACI|nr:hypothetical protein Bca52824_042732 [Brassica carinata]
MCFGSPWRERETLCEGEAIEGKVDPGNPYVLVASSSALRSLELLRYRCEFVFWFLLLFD